jgi:tripartite-type tricarboxylate transporter receptor subunit TctC
MIKNTLTKLFGALFALSLCHPAFSQAYPLKPLHLIMPIPAGGHDIVGRIVAEALSRQLGQPIVVDPRPGASGNIGATFLATSAPDGYTIGLLSGVHTSNSGFFRTPGYDITKDFIPIAAIGETPSLIVARPDLPMNNVNEIVSYSKANPTKLSSTGIGLDLLAAQAGVEFTSVRYKSAGAALPDLAAGRLDLGSGPSALFLPLIADKKLKVIAIGSSRRLAELPGVPTVAESGLPGFDGGIWYGFFVPKNTPPQLVQRLRKDMLAALATPEVRERLGTRGIDLSIATISQEALMQRVAREVVAWKRIAAKTGDYQN